MSNAEAKGRFVWHELMTTDPDSAGTFYSNVIPWKTQPSGMPSYTLWMSGKSRAGGLTSLSAAADGKPPHWIVYIGAPDLDATVEAAQRLGGKVLKSASEVPNVGRFAVLSDPQGAPFVAFSPQAGPSSGEGMSTGALGDFTWHELATTDPEAGLRFYSELFGWGRGAAHDMGAMGTYQLITHGGQDIGGVYKVRDASTPPSWLGYVRVADAGKAASAVKAGGGRVLHGPAEVPGGSWIVMALDPQGGAFAVVEAPAAARAAQGSGSHKKPQAPAKAPATAKPQTSTSAQAPAKTAALARHAAAKKAPAKKRSAAKTARGAKTGRKARAAVPAKKRSGKRAVAKKSTAAKRGMAKRGSGRSARSGTRAARNARSKSTRARGRKRR